jgi:hypothetical protein
MRKALIYSAFQKTLVFKPAKILNISVNQTQRWYNAGICATFLKNSEKYSIFADYMAVCRNNILKISLNMEYYNFDFACNRT